MITAPAAAGGGGSAAAGGCRDSGPAARDVQRDDPRQHQHPHDLELHLAGGTTSIADVFVMGKYISLLDTKVIAGGKSASFEILSREVVHVQIPANVIPTTTEDGQTYIEVYLATPNGMSNSLLIPYVPARRPALAGRLRCGLARQSLDVYYQWATGLDGKPALVVSAPNPKGSIAINWNSDTGLGPKRIQVQFVGTVNDQNIVLSLPGDAVSKGDYSVDGSVFAVTLLNRLQGFTPYPSLPSSPITFTVSVQPFLPTDAEGLRVRTEPKTLKTKLTVNLQYNATGDNVLPNVAPVPVPLPPPKSAAGTGNGRLMSPDAFDGPRLGAAASRSKDDVADPGRPAVPVAAGLVIPELTAAVTVPEHPGPALRPTSPTKPNRSPRC